MAKTKKTTVAERGEMEPLEMWFHPTGKGAKQPRQHALGFGAWAARGSDGSFLRAKPAPGMAPAVLLFRSRAAAKKASGAREAVYVIATWETLEFKKSMGAGQRHVYSGPLH